MQNDRMQTREGRLESARSCAPLRMPLVPRNGAGRVLGRSFRMLLYMTDVAASTVFLPCYWVLTALLCSVLSSDWYICFLLSCHFLVSSRLRVLIDFRPIASSNVLVCSKCLECLEELQEWNCLAARLLPLPTLPRHDSRPTTGRR